MREVWAIILAAGASTRMKTQKLLLPYKGKTIVETVLEKAAETVGGNIMIVLGSHRDQILNTLEGHSFKYCINENYLSGMLSSVICGFNSLPETASAALLYLGDQPQIPLKVSEIVISAWKKSGKGIIMPKFEGRRGHPVLIDLRFKPEIEKLDPEKGLRHLSERFKDEVYEVECSFPEILRDIDTLEEYKMEINKNQ